MKIFPPPDTLQCGWGMKVDAGINSPLGIFSVSLKFAFRFNDLKKLIKPYQYPNDVRMLSSTFFLAPLRGGFSSSAILNLSLVEDVYSKRFSSEMKSLQLRVKLKFCVFPASRWILCSLIHGVQSICPYTEIKEAKASFQFPLYCTCRLLLFQTVSCFLYKLFCPWNSAYLS